MLVQVSGCLTRAQHRPPVTARAAPVKLLQAQQVSVVKGSARPTACWLLFVLASMVVQNGIVTKFCACVASCACRLQLACASQEGLHLQDLSFNTWGLQVKDVQPMLTPDDCLDAEAIAKADPGVQARLKLHGITDTDLVACDPWSGEGRCLYSLTLVT